MTGRSSTRTTAEGRGACSFLRKPILGVSELDNLSATIVAYSSLRVGPTPEVVSIQGVRRLHAVGRGWVTPRNAQKSDELPVRFHDHEAHVATLPTSAWIANSHFPTLQSLPMVLPGASRRKQIALEHPETGFPGEEELKAVEATG